MKGAEPPAPRKSGTAMDGFSPPTILRMTSCPRETAPSPRMANPASNIFLVIASIQTRIRFQPCPDRSPQAADPPWQRRKEHAPQSDRESYSRCLSSPVCPLLSHL